MKRTHFALPEIYDGSLSYYEVLRKLIKSMNVIIDNLNKIPEQIANEAKARLLGDQNLQQNINAEKNAREQADTELQNAINTEKSAREQDAQEIREGVSDKIGELKSDLANKLPKSPANWEAWTVEEQATARERIGIAGNYELIHDETITEDITQYTIDNISLKKAIIIFYSVAHTSDNYLLLTFSIDGQTNKRNGPTVRAVNKDSMVTEYFCYFDGGVLHNFSIGPSVYGVTRNDINTFFELVTGERITGIYLNAYTASEVIPAGCRIKIYGVRA